MRPPYAFNKNYNSFCRPVAWLKSIAQTWMHPNNTALVYPQHAMLLVAEALIISEDTIKDFSQQIVAQEYKKQRHSAGEFMIAHSLMENK